ncbi:MAG TPA: MBL fold metallo-hydrolase [Myxococcaceae bacterium]|nr:MBL fold metallo-hydrolase [Myxococcaceae bacterium]
MTPTKSAVLAALLLTACATSPKTEAPSPTIHTVTGSVKGILANAYLVEGATGVVAVDSALTLTDAKEVRRRLDALGKPLLAVLVTHGHPDHYNGVAILVEGRPETPVYAAAAVARVIRDSDAAKEAQWKPVFGAEWPGERRFPERELSDGESVVLDGYRWTLRSVGPGESHADAYWIFNAGGEKQAFIGDIVLHGVHAYVSDGHTGAWLRTLQRLESELSGFKTLFPGHGAAGDLALLGWQAGYLNTYRAEVERLRKGGGDLSETDTQSLAEIMRARYPGAGLEFLIALGADAVASELAAGR